MNLKQQFPLLVGNGGPGSGPHKGGNSSLQSETRHPSLLEKQFGKAHSGIGGTFSVHLDTLSSVKAHGSHGGSTRHEIRNKDGVAIKRNVSEHASDQLAQHLANHSPDKHMAIMKNY